MRRARSSHLEPRSEPSRSDDAKSAILNLNFEKKIGQPLWTPLLHAATRGTSSSLRTRDSEHEH